VAYSVKITAVIIRTNGRIMAGILRTNEHSHAHRPINGTSAGPAADSPKYGAKLSDLCQFLTDFTVRFYCWLLHHHYACVYRIKELYWPTL